jgi:hypothetical protein
VEGLANLQDVSSRGGRRVTLLPDRTSVGINRNVLESPITADGSFEFPKVLAGKYTVRLSPDVPGVSAAVTLTNSPVRELKLTIPKPAEPPKR